MRRLVALAVVAAALVIAPPASAEDEGTPADCKEIPFDDPTHYATAQPSLPLVGMAVDRAQERLKKEHVVAGAGVTVAVIDSGVSPQAPDRHRRHRANGHAAADPGLLPRHRHRRADRRQADARRRSGRYRTGCADLRRPGLRRSRRLHRPRQHRVADHPREPAPGLDAVLAAVESQGIRIVNISLAIPDDPEIRAKIEQLWSMGVVVVAPTGNRSSEELPPGMPSSFEATPRARTPRRTSTRPTTTTCLASASRRRGRPTPTRSPGPWRTR